MTSLILAVEVLSVANNRPFFCFFLLWYLERLAPIKACFSPLQRKEFMTMIRSFGFQKRPQAVPKTLSNRNAITSQKRFAKCKKKKKKKLFSLVPPLFKQDARQSFAQENGLLCCTNVCAAFVLRSYKRSKTISSSL